MVLAADDVVGLEDEFPICQRHHGAHEAGERRLFPLVVARELVRPGYMENNVVGEERREAVHVAGRHRRGRRPKHPLGLIHAWIVHTISSPR